MKQQKLILVVGLAIILIGIWVLVTYKRPESPSNQLGSISQDANLQNNETLVGQEKVFFPEPLKADQAVIGLADKGQYFTQIDRSTGQTVRLMAEAIAYAPDTVSYAPDGTAAITSREADTALEIAARTTLYLFAENRSVELDPRINEVVWTTSSRRITYIFTKDDGTRQLAEANRDGSDWQILVDKLPFTEPVLTLAPDGQRIAITNRYRLIETEDPTSDPAAFFLLAIFDKSRGLQELLPKGMVSPRWSPDGRKLAYLRVSAADQLGHLVVLDLQTQDETDLKLVSLSQKFAWRSADELAVASPDPPSAGELASDVTLAARDRVWLANLSGSIQELTTVVAQPPLTNLAVVDQGKTLLFQRADFLIALPLP